MPIDAIPEAIAPNSPEQRVHNTARVPLLLNGSGLTAAAQRPLCVDLPPTAVCRPFCHPLFFKEGSCISEGVFVLRPSQLVGLNKHGNCSTV